MRKIIYLLAVMIGILIIFFTGEEEVNQGPGVMAPKMPYQKNLSPSAEFSFKGYTIIKKAVFALEARVLGRERYRTEKNADLVPYDIAFGWGMMSDEKNLEHIDISQSGRFYHWYSKKLPLPRRTIISSSANMHIIPATEEIKDTISELRVGNIVRLKGWLVDFVNSGGQRWKTSLTRNDSGAGSCEIIYVQEIEIIQ